MDWFIQCKSCLGRENPNGFGTTKLYSTPGFYCNGYAQSVIWLQISISAELLIFITRSPGAFFLNRPSLSLTFSVLVLGCALVR